MKQTKPREELSQIFELARQKALDIVISEARDILKSNDNLGEFVLAMGEFFFTLKNSEDNYNPDPEPPKVFSLTSFIHTYDRAFHLTGEGIRFSKDGPLRYDW